MAKHTPISLQHQFFCAMDKGDDEGVFGPRHTNTNAWRLHGQLDLDIFQEALFDVVKRHSILHTSLIRGDDPYYETTAPVPIKLTVSELSGDDPQTREQRAEELIVEVEAGDYPVRELPHLRAFVGRFDADDAVLVLTNHHVASDAWSMRLIIGDIAACYAARKRGETPALPPVPQYPEYAAWQASVPAESMRHARAYWRRKLSGATMLGIPSDRPANPEVPDAYATHRFLLGEDVAAAALRLAKATRSSPFMVLLAAHNVLLSRVTGSTDIVVPTFTSGRDEDRFENTVGTFINFLPLRTDLAGCRDFRTVLERTRQTCTEAYTYDIPFNFVEEEAPELMAVFGDETLDLVAFEALQYGTAMDGDPVDELTYTEIRRRVIPQPTSSAVPDGALCGFDFLPSGEIAGSFRYNRTRFDDDSILRLVKEFEHVLRGAVTEPDSPLTHLY